MLIVTDGAVDVPETLAGSALLKRVPGQVWAGEEPFNGGADEFWTRLREGMYPSTTPPTVNALMEAYLHPDLVIAIHVSGQLSAVMTRAEEAAARAGPGVVAVDTRSLSVGAGLIVGAVQRAVGSPDAPGSLIDFARSLPERLHTFALVQEVESLRRSDRAGLLPGGRLESRHPLVLAVRGRVVPLDQPKHRSGAIKKLVTHVRRSAGSEQAAWALGHGDASDVDAAVDALTRGIGVPPRFVTCIDPTVGAHLGPESLVVGTISGPIDL